MTSAVDVSAVSDLNNHDRQLISEHAIGTSYHEVTNRGLQIINQLALQSVVKADGAGTDF